MMECIHDPWVNAFDRRHNVESLEKMGLNPFTRKPYWKVVKAEGSCGLLIPDCGAVVDTAPLGGR